MWPIYLNLSGRMAYLHTSMPMTLKIYDACPPTSVDPFLSKVSGGLDAVAEWMRSDRFQLNPDKPEFLVCHQSPSTLDTRKRTDDRFSAPAAVADSSRPGRLLRFGPGDAKPCSTDCVTMIRGLATTT